VALRFHWSLSQAGDPWRKTQSTAAQSGLPDLPATIDFCRCAERNGIESLLVAFSFARPDPLVLAAALGAATESIIFLVAGRPGVFSPPVFVQQVNTIAALTGGRIHVNFIVGHSPHEHAYYGDFLPHDERYRRAAEFLDVCAALWLRETDVRYEGAYYRVEGGGLGTPFISGNGATAPEIFLGGNSQQAEELAIRHADCLLRYPDTPEKLRPIAERLAAGGTELGLRVAVLARPTREEALAAAASLREIADEKAQSARRDFVSRTDSVAFRSTLELADGDSQWLRPYLWTGTVPYFGEACLVGSAEDIVAALFEYREAGVTQFLLSGWPDEAEMEFFGREILPRVRAREAAGAGYGT
jgi:alkanesulfonate monooxygenase